MKLLRVYLSGLRSRTFSRTVKLRATEVVEWQTPKGTDTGILVYNLIAKKNIPLILNNNVATWYSCGPTVYDSAHIGHASCYVKLDIVQRILTSYFDVNLVTSMGITDVDDKIINKSIATGLKPSDITIKYELEFWKNMTQLGVQMPHIITRVTEHIPTIINFIEEIIKKGVTYKTSDNSLYFDTSSYSNYGKFHTIDHDAEKKTNSEKKAMSDFALWKGHKKGEPFWETNWGNGRPGWHIECSAMVSRLFGKTVDFHAGGIDLRFPHHENEEAQSCVYHGHNQWVNYWIHAGHLHLTDDVKMSKSLKNTISIDQLLTSYSAATFRMACIMSHYRYHMEYSDTMMATANAVLVKFKSFIEDCNKYTNQPRTFTSTENLSLLSELNQTKKMIDESLRDDFNTSKCLTFLLKLSTETNKFIKSNESIENNFDPVTVALISTHIINTMKCFGISLEKESSVDDKNLNAIVDALVNFRENVRNRAKETKDKDLFKECDNIRDILKSLKIQVNDQKGQLSSWFKTD